MKILLLGIYHDAPTLHCTALGWDEPQIIAVNIYKFLLFQREIITGAGGDVCQLSGGENSASSSTGMNVNVSDAAQAV